MTRGLSALESLNPKTRCKQVKFTQAYTENKSGRLMHLSDKVLEEFEESAENAD